jgi:hypothetical protein
VVSCLQLARSEHHPESGSPVAKIIHSFGCAESVDREALVAERVAIEGRPRFEIEMKGGSMRKQSPPCTRQLT